MAPGMKRRLALVAPSATICGLLLAGCGSGDAPAGADNASAPNGTDRGTASTAGLPVIVLD